MRDSEILSPFHRGEREIQTRLGVRDKIEDIGRRFIRDHMPDEHRAFYSQLPFVLIGSIDKKGRPWASVLVGRPGFAHSPDPNTLKINTRPIFGDPLNEILSVGVPLGLLGIEYQNRRRNRMTGKISGLGDGSIEIKIDQAFGNCPQYIQARNFELLPEIDTIGEVRTIRPVSRIDGIAADIITKSDNFYIATHYSEDSDDTSHGADVSHRGGKPGFVRIENDRELTFPDFVGNYHFNTIGNIALNPRAGLLFIDFQSGDLLYVTGTAEVIWDSEEQHAFVGAERLVSFTLDEGLLVKNAIPIRWNFLEYSPSLENTGSWEAVAEHIAARKEGNIYRNYRVDRVEPESESITSFYLYPEDGDRAACYEAGQFLPIEIRPPGASAPIRRTYTISNAPNGSYYRLSIKREAPASPEWPPGLSSNYFHDSVTAGTTIRAMAPRGKFTLDTSSTRPVVLISGGVGVTPMISMLQRLVSDRVGCGCNRQVWFVHGAINSKVHAFKEYVRKLAKDWPGLRAHFRYSRPLDDDVGGKDYDSVGYVDIDLLKSLLPFDDYEFYLCGPPPFMQSIHTGLKSLNVADERIHYEFFGPGATLHKETPTGFGSLAEELHDLPPATVRFAKSGIDTVWDPSKGTLLDLAESEGVRPEYSCRSGICQTCATHIVSGHVEYIDPPMTDPGQNTALICSAYPRSRADVDNDAPHVILDL